MNYRNKKVAITGFEGFIGTALEKALRAAGAKITILDGDVRDPESFDGYNSALDYSFDYLVHFADPSSQVLFKRNPAYCIDTTMKGIINAVEACRKHGIRLIYPSTGLLSSDRYNEYAMCKKLSEEYVRGSGVDALGIRLFAAYGPGESHKADFASVPYLFARSIVNGKSPVIFGDGEQVRDFIYIDDAVQAILHLAEECYDPIVDVGSGIQTSFNDIVSCVDRVLNEGVTPVKYIDAPSGYVSFTEAKPERMLEFCKPAVTFAEGIKRTVESIKGDLENAKV